MQVPGSSNIQQQIRDLNAQPVMQQQQVNMAAQKQMLQTVSIRVGGFAGYKFILDNQEAHLCTLPFEQRPVNIMLGQLGCIPPNLILNGRASLWMIQMMKRSDILIYIVIIHKAINT